MNLFRTTASNLAGSTLLVFALPEGRSVAALGEAFEYLDVIPSAS